MFIRVRTDFGGSICQTAMEHISERFTKEEEGWRGTAHLFRVVDLPDDGLPTRPISGSRGIFNQSKERRTGYQTSIVAW
jgi:hypothetical protein